MQVGSQFYGHRDCGVWAKMGRPTWCPPCAHILCTRPVSPHPHCVPMPYAHFHVPHLPHVPHLLPLLGFMPRASCPMLTIMPLCPPHAHCHSPMPILCPVPPMPTLCITPYDNTCPSPMLMSHTQCPSLPRAYTSHTPVSNLCPALPMPIFVPTPGASASCPLFPFPLRPSIVKSIAPRAHLVCPLSSVRVPLPTPVPGHSAPRRQRPRCRALTREEAARVEELAGALSLQFVGPRSVRGERAAPVYTRPWHRRLAKTPSGATQSSTPRSRWGSRRRRTRAPGGGSGKRTCATRGGDPSRSSAAAAAARGLRLQPSAARAVASRTSSAP